MMKPLAGSMVSSEMVHLRDRLDAQVVGLDGVDDVAVQPVPRQHLGRLFRVMRLRRLDRVFVVQVVQQPGQPPRFRVLREVDGEFPHAGLDGQAVLDQVPVLQVLLDKFQCLFAGHGHLL